MKLTSLTLQSRQSIPLSTRVTVVAVLGLAPLFGWALAMERWLIVGALGATALIPLVIRWPVISTFGVYALLVSSFDAVPLLQGVATLSRPAGALAAGVLLIVGLMERRLVRPPASSVWWGLLVMWAVLSAAWAVDADMTLRRLPTVLSLFVLYLVTVSLRPTRREFYWVCGLTVLGGVLAASVGYLFGLESGAARGRVVIGDYDTNPNALGRILVPPFALALTAFIGLHGVARKGIAIGCMGVIGMGIYITMSRSALLSMMIVMAVLAYRLQARKQITLAAVMLAVLVTAVPDKFFDRVGRVITGEDATGSGRTEIWEMGFGTLEQFWLFGAGLDNFKVVAYGRGSHNSYLGVTVELGVIGFALMLAAIASHFWALRRATKGNHGALALAAVEAAALGMLTGAMFGERTWSKTFWLMWTLMTWAVYSEGRREAATDVSRDAVAAPEEGLQQRVAIQ